MAEIDDSRAGRYSEPFREAVARFMTQVDDEPWEIRGFESLGQGITIAMRLHTNSGTRYSLFLVPPTQTLSDDILRAMTDCRQSFSGPTHS
jgi:hypothetical protein